MTTTTTDEHDHDQNQEPIAGPSPLPLDEEQSREVGEQVSAEPHGCYSAAWDAVTQGWCGEDALYVEGYAATDDLPIPIRHAWVEVPGVCIVDPVYVLYAPNASRRYFPGARLDVDAIDALSAKIDTLPYGDLDLDAAQATREANIAASEYLVPGLGAQLRKLFADVDRHNRALVATRGARAHEHEQEQEEESA